MSTSYPSYAPYAPPPRPQSAGPRTNTAPPGSPSSSTLSLTAPSASTTPMASPSLVRPSALATRRETVHGQTRLRARSIGKGSQAPVAHLSPTLPGTPVLPDSYAQQSARSPRVRVRTYGAGGEDSSEEGVPFSSTEGTEESGSTRSDESPPPTPRDGEGVPTFEVIPPSRRGSHAAWDMEEERENWRTGGELHFQEEKGVLPFATPGKDVNGRHRSKSLEGQTRMSLRRGRSFTSLLGETPIGERKEGGVVAPPPPIFETYEPPPTPSTASHANSDVESGEQHSPTLALYPPVSSPAVLAAIPAPIATTKRLRDFIPQLSILVALFFSSFALILLTISTLPGLFLPHSVSDLPSLTAAMTTYRASSFGAEVHLFAVLTLLFLWKQCFSIPGSILTNILFGALYGTWMGTGWACLWTATGSTGAYLIAVVIAPLVEYYFATPLAATRRALKLPSPEAADAPTAVADAGVAPLSSSDLFSHLMLARLFPLLPYSVLNVISGVLRLPLSPFFLTLLLGSFPFNFATVSIGELVALAASDPSVPLGDKIWSQEVVLKLVAVTLVSVVPVVFKEQLRRLIANANGGGLAAALERAKDTLARRLFGFGALPHAATSTHSSLHVPSSSLSGGGGSGPRAWRRKLSRSIGGAGEFLQLVGSGLAGRRGYERVDSLALEGESLHHNELSEGVEEAERGGVL
ncbi:hypothetical protein JCM8097_005564 [Rhodosporidiobolus ruineniae]